MGFPSATEGLSPDFALRDAAGTSSVNRFLAHADDLAARFEGYEPDPTQELDANAVGLLGAAVAERSAAERQHR